MTPDQIKAALKTAGWTQVKLALHFKVSKPFIHQIIHSTGKSQRVQSYISKLIKLPVDKIWATKSKTDKVSRA
ncbi:MAG: hypothetical protein GY710_25645 [Desulfobacteraceae bacterium]|nr:hypothetical protein [Desulfobacteraceae bacterium]